MENETLTQVEDETIENDITIGKVVGYAAATVLVVMAVREVRAWNTRRKNKTTIEITDEETE